MQKIITTDDILNDRSLISEERAKKIEENSQAEAMKILHGGKREGAGRKAKGDYSLNITIKVSAVEHDFLKYARANGINLQQLMQGC